MSLQAKAEMNSSSVTVNQSNAGSNRFQSVFARARGSLIWFELLLAFGLTVTYYYLVKGYAAGVEGNSTNYWVFSSCSTLNFHLDELYAAWKGRLGGLLLSGALFDALAKGNAIDPGRYATAFGLYHAFWLLSIFLLIICFSRNAKWINLGIFAGLAYNFTPATGLYFYPCDLPAAFFFTLAVLLYHRQQILLAAIVTCVGSFFRETVLVAALLSLFAVGWKWHWRIIVFLAQIVAYVWIKRLCLAGLDVNAAVFSMGDATRFADLFRFGTMRANLGKMLTPRVNHIVFANAGTLIGVLLLCWKRRFNPYTLLVLIFFLGNFVYASFDEFRTFMQVLPLSWLLLSERFAPTSAPFLALNKKTPTVPADRWSGLRSGWGEAFRESRGTSAGLVILTAVLVGPISFLMAWRFIGVAETRTPHYAEQRIAVLSKRALAREPDAEAEFGLRLLKGDGIAKDAKKALALLQDAADQGKDSAQAQLGFLYATGEVVSQDFAKSLSWLRASALQGDAEAQYGLGCFFEKGIGTERNTSEAALWYQRAGAKGHRRAQVSLGLLLCVGRQEYAEGAEWLRKAAEQGAPDAENALGRLCLAGKGVPQNKIEGLKWLRLAQRRGDKDAENQAILCSKTMTLEEIHCSEELVRDFLRSHPQFL